MVNPEVSVMAWSFRLEVWDDGEGSLAEGYDGSQLR